MRPWVGALLFGCSAGGVASFLTSSYGWVAFFAILSTAFMFVENELLKRDLRFAQTEAKAGLELAELVIACAQIKAKIART